MESVREALFSKTHCLHLRWRRYQLNQILRIDLLRSRQDFLMQIPYNSQDNHHSGSRLLILVCLH